MKKYKGKIIDSDLEGGCRLFKTEDGRVFQLDGIDSSSCPAEETVVIEGFENKNMMGIAMVGPVLTAKKINRRIK